MRARATFAAFAALGLLVALSLSPVLAAARPAGGLAPQLIAGGVIVDWPFSEQGNSLALGSLVRVAVHESPAERVHPFARLTLRVAPGGGRPSHVVARRRMRAGVFRARLKRAAGLRYVLALDVGHEHERAVIRTVAPRIGPSCFGPDPPGVVASGVMSLARAVAAPGDTVTVTLRNTGTACLTSGLDHHWERLVDGVWQALPELEPVPGIAYVTRPGATTVTRAQVHPDMAPGHYRLVKTVNFGSRPSPEGDLTRTAELDVQAP